MSFPIEDLKQQLESAASEQKSDELKAVIEDLKNEAEAAIREHQREVSYDTKEFTLEVIVDKYSNGLDEDSNELFVPDYQRDFVWSKENQSRLIESLLIGLPIPYIFVADVTSDDPDIDGRVEIVDGSQRVRTLHAFVKNKLQLQGLKLLPQINGFHFSDLPASRQRRFNRISVRTIELSNCSEDTRRDLFERINTGSDELKDMEVRKGSYHGSSRIYRDLISVCADIPKFQELVPISESKVKRGERLEFVLRFFAYLNGYTQFDHSVKEFLNEFLDSNAEPSDAQIGESLNIFNAVLDFAEANFPLGFKKSAGSKTTPRVRFEALSVGMALALMEKPDLVPVDVEGWINSDEFKSHTTGDASNSRPRVMARIEFVRDKLLQGS